MYSCDVTSFFHNALEVIKIKSTKSKISENKYIAQGVYVSTKIHLEMQALVVGTKQNKQAQNNADRRDNLPSRPDLSACLPCQPDCFVLVPLVVRVLQSGFLWWPLTLFTKQNKAGGMCH